MDYTNWKKEKEKVSDNEYFSVSEWCNDSGQYTIEERGKYFQVVKIPEPTAEEQARFEIAELKQYLAETDHIDNKLIEAIDNAELQALKEKYAETLKKRRQARARINELEN